jgi:hypothetical protein
MDGVKSDVLLCAHKELLVPCIGFVYLVEIYISEYLSMHFDLDEIDLRYGNHKKFLVLQKEISLHVHMDI